MTERRELRQGGERAICHWCGKWMTLGELAPHLRDDCEQHEWSKVVRARKVAAVLRSDE